VAYIYFHVPSTVKLGLEGDRKSTFIEERQVQDMILGLLLLKTDFWELKWRDFLPQLLDDFGLVSSWMAILYEQSAQRLE
jgi:hypothetical protein